MPDHRPQAMFGCLPNVLNRKVLKRRFLSVSLILSGLLWLSPLTGMTGPALADATVPTADISGAADSPLLKRYDGSFIVSYDQRAFDELLIPLSPLKMTPTQGETDRHNNRVYRSERSEQVEGKVTRLAYVLPENRSPLEVLRNYQDEITAAGGEVLFECKREECGGDPNRASSGGGGKMSLTMQFFYESDVKDKAHSNGACALTQRIDDQRYLAARIPQSGQMAWVAVQVFLLNTGPYCKALNGRAIAIVHTVEPKPREQRMVVVAADEMARTIDQDGSIALYGILFDTDKADLKPESEPTLAEIAKLLSSQPKLEVLVVGHTDNQGAQDYNLTLSAKRANAVRDALIGKHGIAAARLTAAGAGMMAPVASNLTDEGRARNRRVGIVRVK